MTIVGGGVNNIALNSQDLSGKENDGENNLIYKEKEKDEYLLYTTPAAMEVGVRMKLLVIF